MDETIDLNKHGTLQKKVDFKKENLPISLSLQVKRPSI